MTNKYIQEYVSALNKITEGIVDDIEVTERVTPKRLQKLQTVVDQIGDYLYEFAVEDDAYLSSPEDMALDFFGTDDPEVQRKMAKVAQALKQDLKDTMQQFKQGVIKDLQRTL